MDASGALDDALRDTADAAKDVDSAGRFPTEALAALRTAGVLGLTVPTDYGGGGQGFGVASEVIARVARVCGSTAMVVTMHYAATAALVSTGRTPLLAEIAAGRHLTTLAFSEVGSRSQFWAPLGTATAAGDDVLLEAEKSWVTSAHAADTYVWSSRPLSADGVMTLWSMPSVAPGLSVAAGFDGLGLRGNDSCAVSAQGVRVPADAMLGPDGRGLDIAMEAVLPWFLLLNASAGLGMMQAVMAEATDHLVTTRLTHLDEPLARQLPSRTRLATMRLRTDCLRALVRQTAAALDDGHADAPLLALEVKAAADEASAAVTDLAMQVCGGAAFRKDLGIERRFRDTRAARVMAPTSDALLDFIGRALCGLPLLDA
jgi:alkylation response protein AidB-like acyl-CoA dehydrogenase